jgi:hypothetical protein
MIYLLEPDMRKCCYVRIAGIGCNKIGSCHAEGLHNGELADLHSWPNIIGMIKSRRMRWAEHVARMEKRRGVYRVLMGKPEGNRPHGGPRRRWENNIKMDFQDVGWKHGLD